MDTRTPALPLAFALAACAGASSSSSTSHTEPTAAATSSGVPGSSAAVHVTLRRVIVDEIDRAADPSRVLPPSASAAPEDAQARRAVIDALEAQRSAIAQCYQHVRVDTSDALGNVDADLAFTADGTIHDTLLRAEPVLEPMRACMSDALRAATMHPAPGHEIGVHATYRFQPHGATLQESRYRLTITGAHASSSPAPSAPACVPLVLQAGYVTDNSEDEARRYPSLPTWDHAQRERLLARLTGLHDCYARLLAHSPSANGAVQLRVVLAPDGAAQTVRADGPAELRDVAECARTAVTGARFCPGPDATMTVLLTGIEFLPQ
jgi:hypothetical protein